MYLFRASLTISVKKPGGKSVKFCTPKTARKNSKVRVKILYKSILF